jgi:hypothetical protein
LNLSKLENIVVSVYVDDIFISSNNSNALSEILCDIKLVADVSGFPFNEDKEEGSAQSITAFNIRLCRGSMEITDYRLHEFLEVYRSSDNPAVLKGITGYIATVNPAQADFISGCTAVFNQS